MKTLIVLHGWQSSKEKWQKVKDLLEKEGIEAIVPDIPGFKPETELTRVWTLDDYVEWFNNFSQERTGFFLLGHSFGGRIAIKFASQYPCRLQGLLLVSAAGIKKQQNFFGKIVTKGAELVKKFKIEEMPFSKGLWRLFRKFFYRYILRKTDYFNTSGFLKETIKNILDEDLVHLFPKIMVPTNIIWGEKDKITPIADAHFMKEQIKFSELEVMPGIGHTPQLEKPELLAEKIIKFLK